MPLTAVDVILARQAYLEDLKGGELSRRSSCSTRPRSRAPRATLHPPSRLRPRSRPPLAVPAPRLHRRRRPPPARPRRIPPIRLLQRSVAAREPGSSGAPVDLWDSGWPNGRFFWTVVPVAFESAAATQTALATATAPGAGSSGSPVSTGFATGQLIRLGTGPTRRPSHRLGDSRRTRSSTTTAATYAHGAGELVENLTATLDYWDQELPQDVCSSGRVQSFGKAACRSSPARPPRLSRGCLRGAG